MASSCLFFVFVFCLLLLFVVFFSGRVVKAVCIFCLFLVLAHALPLPSRNVLSLLVGVGLGKAACFFSFLSFFPFVPPAHALPSQQVCVILLFFLLIIYLCID